MKETLKYLREEFKLSQSDVAARVGISRQTYIKYESGEAEPSVAAVRQLAELYGVAPGIIIENKYSFLPRDVHRDVQYEIAVRPPLRVESPRASYTGVFDGTCVRPLEGDFPALKNQKVTLILQDEFVVDKKALVEKLYGCLSHKANPALWSQEEGAWARHCEEKYGKIKEEIDRENLLRQQTEEAT